MNDFVTAVIKKHIPHKEEEPPHTARSPVGPSSPQVAVLPSYDGEYSGEPLGEVHRFFQNNSLWDLYKCECEELRQATGTLYG
jgi:hypothetical protein